MDYGKKQIKLYILIGVKTNSRNTINLNKTNIIMKSLKLKSLLLTFLLFSMFFLASGQDIRVNKFGFDIFYEDLPVLNDGTSDLRNALDNKVGKIKEIEHNNDIILVITTNHEKPHHGFLRCYFRNAIIEKGVLTVKGPSSAEWQGTPHYFNFKRKHTDRKLRLWVMSKYDGALLLDETDLIENNKKDVNILIRFRENEDWTISIQ